MTHVQRRPYGSNADDGSGLARGNQILPVAELPLDFDGIPVDGAQYLAVVRRQAKSAPSVVRHSSYVDVNDGCSPPQKQTGQLQADAVPSQEWRTSFLANFGNMRRSLENRRAPDGGAAMGIPQVRNPSKWFYFVYGRSSDHQGGSVNTAAQMSPPTSSREPSPSLLQHFYPKQILALLEAIALWIEEDWMPLGVNATESRSLHRHNSRWIFALLSHLDDQLVGDDISTLRSLARCCLAQVVEGRKGRAGGSSLEEESGAWIAICAVAGIWAQHDLWDEAVELLSRQNDHDEVRLALV